MFTQHQIITFDQSSLSLSLSELYYISVPLLKLSARHKLWLSVQNSPQWKCEHYSVIDTELNGAELYWTQQNGGNAASYEW